MGYDCHKKKGSPTGAFLVFMKAAELLHIHVENLDMLYRVPPELRNDQWWAAVAQSQQFLEEHLDQLATLSLVIENSAPKK